MQNNFISSNLFGKVLKTLPASLKSLVLWMNFFHMDGIGYLPEYARSDITDALHEKFGFRTDTEIVTEKNMKKIIKDSKR